MQIQKILSLHRMVRLAMINQVRIWLNHRLAWKHWRNKLRKQTENYLSLTYLGIKFTSRIWILKILPHIIPPLNKKYPPIALPLRPIPSKTIMTLLNPNKIPTRSHHPSILLTQPHHPLLLLTLPNITRPHHPSILSKIPQTTKPFPHLTQPMQTPTP